MITRVQIGNSVLAILAPVVLIACASNPPIPDEVHDEDLINIGMPFERAMMAYVRNDIELTREELHKAEQLNPADERVSYLLCHIDAANCNALENSEEELSPLKPKIESVEHYLSLVAGHSPRLRNSLYAVVEQKSVVTQKRLDAGPVLTILTRFYPEAIFATLTKRLVTLAKRPAIIQRQNAILLQNIAAYADTKNEVFTEAVGSYVEYVTARKQLVVLEGEHAAQNHVVNITRALVDQGYKPEVEFLEAEVMRNSTARLLHSTQMRLANSRQHMADLAGLDPEQLSDIATQNLVLPDLQAATAYSVSELDVLTSETFVKSSGESRLVSGLSLTKVDLFASYGKNFREERSTFVRGWSTGMRFQIPLMIRPISRARLVQRDAVIHQVETELEYSVISAREEWLDSYRAYSDAAGFYDTASGKVEVNRRKVQILETSRLEGIAANRLQPLQAYIRYYRSLYAQQAADAKQQKSAFRWFRAQGLATEEIEFSADENITIDHCGLEHHYLNPIARAMEIRNPDTLNSPEHNELLVRFALMNEITTLVVPVWPRAFQSKDENYNALTELAHAAGINVIGRLAVKAGDITADARVTERLDGIKLYISGASAETAEQNIRSAMANYQQLRVPVTLEFDVSTLKSMTTPTILNLIKQSDAVSILVTPDDLPQIISLQEQLHIPATKLGLNLNLEASAVHGAQVQKGRPLDDFVNSACREIGAYTPLRIVGFYAFEDYIAQRLE